MAALNAAAPVMAQIPKVTGVITRASRQARCAAKAAARVVTAV